MAARGERIELYRERLEDVNRFTDRWHWRYAGKWRWRYRRNGYVMADSGQGYSRRIDCVEAMATVLNGLIGDGSSLCRCNETEYNHVPVHDLTKGSAE